MTLRASSVRLIEGRLERHGDAFNIVVHTMMSFPIEPPVADREAAVIAKQPKMLVTPHDHR